MNNKITKRIIALMLVCLLAFTICSCTKSNNSEAQGESQAETQANTQTGTENLDVISQMGIGWNLGNSLDAEGGNGLDTEINWGNPRTTEKMILDVKAMGFDTIRIPTTWGQHCDENGIVDEAWMKRVKEVVDYAYNNDMFVILNSHHDNGYYQIGECVKDDNVKAQSIEKMKLLWSQIATEFKDYDQRLIFEAMNEPRTIGSELEWQGGTAEEREVIYQLNEEIVKSIRETGGNNESRYIMLSSYGATADTNILKEMKLPDDSNIIVSIHAYSPYNFAMNADESGEFTNSDKKELDNLFKEINKIFIEKDIPVIIGEFGVINKDNLSERCEWAEYYVKGAAKYGIPCIVWDNNIDDIGSETFGLYNRFDNSWYYPELAKAYVNAINE